MFWLVGEFTRFNLRKLTSNGSRKQWFTDSTTGSESQPTEDFMNLSGLFHRGSSHVKL